MSERLDPVLVLGARSAVGLALAHAYGRRGFDLVLAARDAASLERDAADLRLRHKVEVRTAELDILHADPAPFFDALGGCPGTVACVVGLLGDQGRSERDPAAATLVMTTNYLGPARFLGEAANRMAAEGRGAIVCVSSVAGERGRASNYVYGSAKAGLTAFLSGLRNRLAKRNVTVLTVLPGFIRTPMTAGMKLPPLITAEPEGVAEQVVKAQLRGADVIHAGPIWSVIMLIIRLIPERLFKKLSL